MKQTLIYVKQKYIHHRVKLDALPDGWGISRTTINLRTVRREAEVYR